MVKLGGWPDQFIFKSQSKLVTVFCTLYKAYLIIFRCLSTYFVRILIAFVSAGMPFKSLARHSY